MALPGGQPRCQSPQPVFLLQPVWGFYYLQNDVERIKRIRPLNNFCEYLGRRNFYSLIQIFSYLSQGTRIRKILVALLYSCA